MKKIFLLCLFSFSAFANLHLAPPSVEVGSKKAIWVDFQKAEYNITYDMQTFNAAVITNISFTNLQIGYPIFDLLDSPEEIILDGDLVSQTEVSLPEDVSKVRMINKKIAPGLHTLSIKSRLQHGLMWNSLRGISSAFFIRDLKDRDFLEKYVPANYEYDQYPMTFNIQITGSNKAHHLYANGMVKEVQPNMFTIEYPAYFTSTSVFYHLAPESRFWRLDMKYSSIDGRQIPLTIYSNFRVFNHFLKKKALKVIAELENDYGPWPHPKIIIYGTKPKGGMEYCGATATSLVSVGHELFHSYFAKGVMPANGNSGWMDEALASWRDKGYQRLEAPLFGSKNLANHSVYTRKTDSNSYEVGRSFMGYVDHRVNQSGHDGLKAFMRSFVAEKKHHVITTFDFIAGLEKYTGETFLADFQYYVMGIESAQATVIPMAPEEEVSDHPRAYTEKELQSLL